MRNQPGSWNHTSSHRRHMTTMHNNALQRSHKNFVRDLDRQIKQTREQSLASPKRRNRGASGYMAMADPGYQEAYGEAHRDLAEFEEPAGRRFLVRVFVVLVGVLLIAAIFVNIGG